jgi:hypothetical protein
MAKHEFRENLIRIAKSHVRIRRSGVAAWFLKVLATSFSGW